MKKPRSQETKKPKAIPILSVPALLMAISVLLIAGCDPANNNPFVYQIVLQGQMYVGHAPEIRLTHTISLEERFDASEVGVAGASVELKADSLSFNLIERVSDPRGSGYYGLAPTDTHIVTPGMRYSIKCVVGRDTLTAQTRAAGFMDITSQNLDTVVAGPNSPELVLHWRLDSLARGYWAIYENLNPHHGDDSCWLNLNNKGPDKNVGVWASYWSAPPTADSIRSPRLLFSWSGLYRVRVFSCDSALWYFANTFQPGQVELNPITNVDGGLGVFYAGGVDTTYFYMAKDSSLQA